MHIHHFYPRTNNIGDHFVQRGIERMVREILPDTTFELFDINRHGSNKADFGITHFSVERANREADLIIIGGSNLYEGNFRWPWGVHLEVEALRKLRVPLFIIGVGSGSNFLSPLHQPSARAKSEIRLLNHKAGFSGVRDVLTLDWLRKLGVAEAKLIGDPAMFVANESIVSNTNGHILIAIPPRRFWSNKRQFISVRWKGRPLFRGLVGLTKTLRKIGHRVVVVCNDPLDLEVASRLFGSLLPDGVVCPKTVEEYLKLLSASRVVISGRLHTAAVSLSMGIPFLLIDCDQRTHGFIRTYELEDWAFVPSRSQIEASLLATTNKILSSRSEPLWKTCIEKRDSISGQSIAILREAFESIVRQKEFKIPAQAGRIPFR